MIFKTLKDRTNYYRDLFDYKITPNSWYIIMLDGHSFSKSIKKRYKRPFDDVFVSAMDETALHLCKKLQNIKYAFIQSDEINLFCKDESASGLDFNGRLCKLQSICAGIATAKFNHILWELGDKNEYEFDCKVWSVPNEDEANAWLRYRMNDCVRNAVNSVGEHVLGHKAIKGKKRNEVIEMLNDKGYYYNLLPAGIRFGRIISQHLEIRNGVMRNTYKLSPRCNDDMRTICFDKTLRANDIYEYEALCNEKMLERGEDAYAGINISYLIDTDTKIIEAKTYAVKKKDKTLESIIDNFIKNRYKKVVISYGIIGILKGVEMTHEDNYYYAETEDGKGYYLTCVAKLQVVDEKEE